MQRWCKTSLGFFGNHSNCIVGEGSYTLFQYASSCVLVKLGVLKRDDVYGVLAHEDSRERRKDRFN